MNKFGFSQEQLEEWKDKPIFLKGTKDTAIVLIHGWSSIPRQIETLAYSLNRRGYWVSVPMLKGHGTQPEDLANATWQDWLKNAEDAVKELRKKNQLKKIIIGGTSMGGNIALLASQEIKVDGIILIGTPVHLRNHFWIWAGATLGGPFMKYIKKRYPPRVKKEKAKLKATSYQYFPLSSVKQVLSLVRESVFSLKKVTAPVLVIQTNTDYLVAKYSPWIIYNAIGSTKKKLQWIKSENNTHILISEDIPGFFSSIEEFINDVEQG